MSAETAALIAQLRQRLQDREQLLVERDALLQRKDREIEKTRLVREPSPTAGSGELNADLGLNRHREFCCCLSICRPPGTDVFSPTALIGCDAQKLLSLVKVGL